MALPFPPPAGYPNPQPGIPAPGYDQWTQPDSRHAGYIRPTADSPEFVEDAALETFLQNMVVGITGLAGMYVRPRWQMLPPETPERDIDWCAIGVMDETPDANAAFVHHGYSPQNQRGYSEMQRHEELVILSSFYGANCRSYAHLLRDGLSVAQNREAMMLNGMGLVASGPIRPASELINMAWRRRYDVEFAIRHVAVRYYPVRNILTAHGTIVNDYGQVEDWATQPYPEPKQLELPLEGASNG